MDFNAFIWPLYDRISAKRQETTGMKENRMGSGH